MRFSIGLAIGLIAASAGAEVHDCDREAAHPSDPDKVVDGRSSGEVVTHRAIPACRRAVEDHPREARFHYQLGRAIVYWADANGADYGEGLQHLERAADMGHTQALFVLGLMYQREDRMCEAVPVMKRAADQGLKAARITFVDHVVSGRFDRCAAAATIDEMQAWLDAATAQVDGYYENMLLAGLKRQLSRWGQ